MDGGQPKVGKVLAARMYVNAPTGKSKEDLETLLFDRVPRRNCTDSYDEKKYSGAGLKEVQTWWKTCKEWMTRYKTHSEPFIYDIKKLLKALSDKEAAAQSEVDAFMENCAKRWQTREGTHQLKRRRLPDVCDLSEYPERVLTWRTSNNRQHSEVLRGGREHLRG